MQSSVTYEHGEYNCAIEAGKFCRWVTSRRFGAIAWCYLYQVELSPSAERGLERCDLCLQANPPPPRSLGAYIAALPGSAP